MLVVLWGLAGATDTLAEKTDQRPPVPRIEGDWWRVTPPPDLEPAPGRTRVEAVDFTIYQAADGTWQLISCMRHTTEPGSGRLLYRWEAPALTDEGWQPQGVFAQARPEIGHRRGRLQAPHCVRADGRYYLFYNSSGAHCMVSEDGKAFTDHRNVEGEYRFFQMPRDLMLLDNCERDGLWYAYYTDIVPGRYLERNTHTISIRTAPQPEGPWSGRTDIGVTTPVIDPRYSFVHAESPFVFYRDGWYYRLEQNNVIASRSPREWPAEILTSLMPDQPLAYLAPEIIEADGEMYIAAYSYSGGRRGIYMARLVWE